MKEKRCKNCAATEFEEVDEYTIRCKYCRTEYYKEKMKIKKPVMELYTTTYETSSVYMPPSTGKYKLSPSDTIKE